MVEPPIFIYNHLTPYHEAFMAAGLHEYLKEATRCLHEQAEGAPFQAALAQGKLPLPSYTEYLIQLTHLHERFETRLKEAAVRDQLVSSVVVDDYFQLPFLQADLRALASSQAAQKPLQCIVDFCAAPVFNEQPVSLLGVLYVLLGSKHGSKFIAHNVKQAYKLDGAGWSYFDPFGERFRPLWKSFTSQLSALPDDESINKAVLQGANDTFNLFTSLGDHIWRARRSAASA